jgi:hypothetical protein
VHFGVSKSVGAARSTEIRKMLNIGQFDPDWTLPSRLGQNPLVWMVEVDGVTVDTR